MKKMLTTILAVLSVTAFADDPITYIEFIGKATKSSDTAMSDITNIAKWGDGATALSPDSDYLISGGKYCGFGGTGTFPGKSLTLGILDVSGGVLATISSSASGTFDFGTLVLNRGTIYHKAQNADVVVNATVTVNATSASPFNLSMGGASGGKLNLTGSISGSGYLYTYQADQTKEYSIVRLKSDMSGFTGTLTVGPNNVARTVRRSSLVYFGDTEINGTIKVNPCGVISPCGAGDTIGVVSVKNLSFEDEGTIRLGVNTTTGGTVRVMNAFSLPASGRVTLDVTSMPNYNFSVRRHPVLIVPAGTGLSADAFNLNAVKNAGGELYGKLSICKLLVDTSSPDCEILYLEMPKYTAHSTADDYAKSCWLPDYASHWYGMSAGTPLDSETIYLGYLRAMQTPTLSQSDYHVFPGKKLVYSGREIELNYSVTINDFTLMNGVDVRFRYHNNAHFYGNICITNFQPTTGNAATFSSSRGYGAYLDATLCGPGNVRIYGSKYSYALSSATFWITADNSDFVGKMTVSNEQNSPVTNTTLRITAANQLGGARTEFAYDALTFMNWSRFRADASLNLNEPTRGVYFLGGNYVNIPTAANTLTLSTQTTLAGTLVKEGPGTLALGGVLKFTSAQSDVPTVGTNELQVAAGCIRPASKTGADGLAITFASGTGIKLAPVAETDPDVNRYGLYDVKWATPFDLTATDGKLNVALDLPEDASEIPDNLSFGVCTVPSAAASSLVGNIVLPAIRGYALNVEPVANGDDTVTFAATYVKSGFTIIIK